MTYARAWMIAVALAACAGPPSIPAVRFANAPAVQVVDDRRDVPKQPAVRRVILLLYHFHGTVQRAVTRTLELPRPRRALGVNALDEVPDSTWFTNRIGVRDLTLDELRRGPATAGSPEPHKPWTILSTKVGGKTSGFIMTDARGERFVLKFDRAGFPEVETAADVITGKLLWAIGYNVPEDHVVHFRADDLVLAPDATVKDIFGGEQRLDRKRLVAVLTTVEGGPDGRMRGLASRFLDGEAVGGHPAEGVRSDDSNDRIRHELRRDLRGTRALFAWLDHGDIKEDNFLDMWVADSASPDHHYVKHYLLDFGLSLGAMATLARDRRRSHEYKVDFGRMLGALITGGLFRRPWENRSIPPIRGIGLYENETYHPGGWLPMTPAYIPLLTADRFDQFWSSKLLIRFTRSQLRAVVETALLSDPRAVDYLVDTLVARQRATARYWFLRVNPLDQFALTSSPASPALCFDDLALRYQLVPATATATHYRIRTYNRAAAALGAAADFGPASDGHTCSPPLSLATDGDHYTIVRIDTTRPGNSGSTLVHLARAPTGSLRVIGIWRL